MENKMEMNLKFVKDNELIERFGKLVASERKIMHRGIEYIAEIDRRKIYLERAYPSLFEMLTKEFGYSEASAMRRIEAARFMRELPAEDKVEFTQQLEDGTINLSQISMVQKIAKQVHKKEHRKVSVQEKRDLMNKIEGQNMK